MTLPAVYSLAEAYPGVDIDVLTRPFFARIFVNRPANVRLLTADFRTEYRGAAGMLRLFRRLRGNGYDCVADLHNVSRSWQLDALFRLTGTPVYMVDKMRRDRAEVLRGRAAPCSFILRYADVFARAGLPVRLTFRSLYEGVAAVPPLDIPAGSVGIAPFARYMTKTYPAELMEQVVRLLTERGVSVFLFGAKGDEASVMNGWAASYSGCTSLAGRYAIEDELALMSRLTLMVAMDSANQHLAAIAGTRVLTLWGGTAPACGFTAYGQRNEDSVVRGLPCQPCSIGGSPQCRLGTTACLREIEPAETVRRVLEILDEEKKTNI